MAKALRIYTGTYIPDGPPRLTHFLAEVLPLIWELPPRIRPKLPPDVMDKQDRDRLVHHPAARRQ